MQFDPTHDYALTDLTIDDNLTRWKFAELIKTVITLASDAARQFEIIGAGAACDEMAEDFNTHFTLSYCFFLDNHLLTTAQVAALQDLDAFINEQCDGQHPDFWDDRLLGSNPDWTIVRQKAIAILQLLGTDDLEIEFERKEKYKSTANGKRLLMQSTKTKLIRKNAH